MVELKLAAGIDNIAVNSQEVNEWCNYCITKVEGFSNKVSGLEKISKNFPNNTSADEVMFKIALINKYYSTNILDNEFAKFADYIVRLSGIDAKLQQGDLTAVDDLADKSKTKLKNNSYVFATKYCFIHNPDKYPICDKFVGNMLWQLQIQDHFYSKVTKSVDFEFADLENYKKFYDIFNAFISYYGLQGFTYRELDNFLWAAGKYRYF